jgi:drug/metabolite transporter (DMT)-like permease
MNPKLMVWVSVLLSAVAQIFLKHGLNRVKSSRAGAAPGSLVALVLGVAGEVWIWLWAACFAVATGLWLLGVQRLDLSYAFPLLSIGYILVNFLSMIFFRERVDGMRWMAVCIISGGVLLIASS